MENKEMKELELIPEDRLFGALEYIEESNVIESICPECKSFISIKLHPYAYDTENNYVVYVSRCPNCGKVLYTKD